MAKYDLIVIGSGPGGYVSAIRASQLGLKTCVIEKEKTGGVCLNIGCIPTKALIHQAGIFRAADELVKMGVSVDKSNFNYEYCFKKSRKAADMLSRGVEYLFKKNNIELIRGKAVIKDRGIVSVGDDIIEAENILVATGSRPREIPGFSFDGEHIISSNDALMLEKLPSSIIILGAGAIGVEFAHILNSFGVKVHLVEMLDHILPAEDEEVTQVLSRAFRRRKIEMYVGTKATGYSIKEGKVILNIVEKDGSEKQIEGEKLLVVVGRVPNTEEIGLEEVGIKLNRGFVDVGDYYKTSVDGIFAAGDIVNSPLLAHVASKEGEIAVEYMAGIGKEKVINLDEIPAGVYSEPQVAGFGYTEERAEKEGVEYKKAIFPYKGAGKAVAIESSDGLVKIIVDKNNRIIGAHIVGADATELIHELLLAKKIGISVSEIASMIHAHPTLSEALMEASRAVEGWAIHV